jgi:Protein of unknown function (DUF3037)
VLTKASFDYAVLRVVPRVERQEFLNIGVIVFCLQKRLLEAKVHVDGPRLQTLWPMLDLETVKQHADAVIRICAGDATAGPVAKLSQRERFQWLIAPRSTIIQTSAVHTGILTEDDLLADRVERLFEQLVAITEFTRPPDPRFLPAQG